MSTPLVVQFFESVTNAKPTSSWEALAHQTLEIVKEGMGITDAAQASTPLVYQKTLITDMGDYLTQAALLLHRLTEKLVCGPHVEMAVVEALNQAMEKNRVSELSPIFCMDLEIQKLRKIRDLTEKFSRDVMEIWLPVPPASPDSSVQQKAL